MRLPLESRSEAWPGVLRTGKGEKGPPDRKGRTRAGEEQVRMQFAEIRVAGADGKGSRPFPGLRIEGKRSDLLLFPLTGAGNLDRASVDS